MELITKNYFYKIVGDSNKDWNVYRIYLPDFNICKGVCNLNYILIDNIIPAAYIFSLEQLIIPSNYILGPDRLEQLKNENLTIDTWYIKPVDDLDKNILTRNELSRVPYYANDDFIKSINELQPFAFTIKSTLDDSFKEELIQVCKNPEKYSYRKNLICNSCVKDTIFPDDFWMNYLYNIIMLIINLKYI